MDKSAQNSAAVSVEVASVRRRLGTYLRQQSESAVVAVSPAASQSRRRCAERWIVKEAKGRLVARFQHVGVLR